MFSSFLHNFLKLASSTALFATAIVAPTGARADGRADTVWMRGGHSGVVGQIAYSPDGQTFVTASDDLTVKIWRVADRQLIRTLIPLGAPCSDIAFSPDGRMLALATRASTKVLLYETSGYKAVTNLVCLGDGVDRIMFSPSGDRLVVAGYDVGELEIFSAGDWTKIGNLHADGEDFETFSAVFSSDGTKLLVAQDVDDEGRLTLWNQADGHRIWSVASRETGDGPATFSADGTNVLWGFQDGTLQIRDATDGSLQRTLNTSNTFSTPFTFSPDGHSLAIASKFGGADVLDWPSGQVRYRLPDSYEYGKIVFSPDGRLLTASSGYRRPGGNGGVGVWRAADGLPQSGFDEHAGKIERLVFSPDSSLLASGGMDYTVRLWRVATGERVALFRQSYPISVLAFSPDSSLVVASGKTDQVGLWRTDGTLVRNLNHPFDGVREAAFSPDGRFLAVAFGPKTIVFDVASGNAAANGPSSETFQLGRRTVISPDQVWSAWYVASYPFCTYGLCGLLLSGHVLETPRDDATPRAMAFAADSGTLLITGPGPVLKFFGTTSLKLVQTYTDEIAGGVRYPITDGGDRVIGGWTGATAVAYSGDGQYFAYGRVDGTVVLARNQFATPVQMSVRSEGASVQLKWHGGNRYYQLQRRGQLDADTWQDVGWPTTTTNLSLELSSEAAAFYRVRNLGN